MALKSTSKTKGYYLPQADHDIITKHAKSQTRSINNMLQIMIRKYDDDLLEDSRAREHFGVKHDTAMRHESQDRLNRG